MKRLISSLAILGAWAVAPALASQEPEHAPINVTFEPNQLQGETYIWQVAQTGAGQMIVSGERIGFYDNDHWEFLAEPRKTAIRCLVVDGDTLWVGSLNDIGSVSLPLSANSRYRSLGIPELASAGEIWSLLKSGDKLVATTADEVWIIDLRTHHASHEKIPTQKHLWVRSWNGHTIVTQPDVALWEVVGTNVVPFENPLPPGDNGAWIWTDSNFVLTTRGLYKKESDRYRLIANTQTLNETGRITSATAWDHFVAMTTLTKGLALFDKTTGTLHFSTPASGLTASTLEIACSDSGGRLWVGTSAGLTVFEGTRFGRRIPAPSVRFASRNGGLFISYEDHADFFRDDGVTEKLSRTYEFIPTPNGNFFGFWGECRIGDKTLPAAGNRIGATIVLPSGDMLTTATSRIYFLEPSKGTSTLIDGPPTEVTGFACIGDMLWAITADGILYHAPTKPPFTFTKVATRPGAIYPKLHALGDKLIMSSREGVRYGENFREVENTHGISGQEIAANADGLWLVGAQDGLLRLGKLVRHGDAVAWDTFAAKGLTRLSEVHSMMGSGHVLSLCGDSTILELNSDQLTQDYRLGTPQLTFTYRDSRTGSDTKLAAPPAEIAYDDNSIAFTGTLAFDEFGERPRFERRLMPTETTWVPTKIGETVSYPSLSPRTYTLEVRATHLGHTGAIATHVFTVLPPWYATPGAAAGYVACAALGFFGLYRLRTRQIRRRTAELERIVQERTHALAEASAAKTEFLANMSHEIRNPMNGVIGLVEILREQPAVSPKQSETLRLLHHCADQLRNTVDDILDFSKIEAGRVGLESANFDLRETLEAAAATIDPTGMRITFLDKPPAGTALVGDVGKLRQIFANYLSNALKYGVPPAARVSTLLSDAPGGIRLMVGVASSGPTIPKDTLDQFFDSFTRGNDAIERNIHGTGLGLAICRKYAQAMGGEVGAVSANGETTFYLNVPFASASAESHAKIPIAPPSTLPAKALAIEDEDYNRIVLGSILQKMNYTVDWATTGEEALKLAQENGYDIILTDYRLPDTNGVELTKKILKFCPDPKPAVFAVTAYSTKERRDECLNAGMSGFISKPITLEKLRTTLAGWGEHNLAKISLEAGRLGAPVFTNQPPAEIMTAWDELGRLATLEPKRAADLAHKLNNLCRAHGLIDVAEQFELLEGALERGESPDPFLRACGEFLRP